jgi:hypothetical protein
MEFFDEFGVLYNCVRLDESFPMDMTSGPTIVTVTSAVSRGTSTEETPETVETHVEKRLKLLWVRIRETLKRLRSTSAGEWWLVRVIGGQKWVVGSSKAVNVACLAVFDPDTNSALSRQPEPVKTLIWGYMILHP